MIIKCHYCKTECPSLGRWHCHLLSKGHQTAVKNQVKADPQEEEVMKTTIFFLRPSAASDESSDAFNVVEALYKFSNYGFLHDFYVHDDGTSNLLAVANLELGNGITHEFIVCESESFGCMATPFLASTSQDWDGFILGLNTTKEDELVQKLSSTSVGDLGDNNASKDCKLSLSSTEPPSSLEQRPGASSRPRRKTKAVPTANPPNDAVILTVTALNESFYLHFNNAQLTKAQLEEREVVLCNLESCLRTWFSNCPLQLHHYGSYLTGLGDQNSDLDVTMTGHEMTELSGVELAKEIRTALKKHRPNGSAPFTKIQMILSSVEVVRFTDVSTRISCDLTFSNLLAVRNSELIAFIVGLDPRIRQLVLLVQRWGKFYKLTASTKLKNYAVVLLVLVFLARKKFIPTIETLQSLGEEEIIGDWNAGFTRDPEAVQSLMLSSRNAEESNYHANANLLQLTRDFFNFFASEDFDYNVLCSLTAESIPKGHFRSPESMKGHSPNEIEPLAGHMETSAGNKKMMLQIKRFTVQDPFDLASNVGKSVSKKVLNNLVHIVGKTAEYFSSLDESPSSRLQLFPTIEPKPSKREAEDEFYSQVIEELSPLLDHPERASLLKEVEDPRCSKMQFHLDQEFAYVFSEFNSGVMDGNQKDLMHQLWLKFATLFISRVWSHCYLLDCEENVILDRVVDDMVYDDDGGVLFCNHLNVQGPAFPPGPLFEFREEQRRNKEEYENPLEEDRAVRIQIKKKGSKSLKFKCLAVLYIDEDLVGPHFVLFKTGFHTETIKQNKNMLQFITTGIRRSFSKYQVHLLRKWIANGQNLNAL